MPVLSHLQKNLGNQGHVIYIMDHVYYISQYVTKGYTQSYL